MDSMLFPYFFAPHTNIERLGSGGYGDVFKARLSNGQLVAVKYLRDNTPENYKDFCREVAQLEELADEPFIVNILGKNLTAPTPYFYMELCEGTLADFIGRFTSEEIITILHYIVLATLSVHSKFGFHRDIKPKNILMRRVGDVYVPVLSDFGVARLPNSQTLMTQHGAGTPPYQAPELAEGKLFTQASDIFSLGITFFEMFSGQPARPWIAFNIPGNLNTLLFRMTDPNPLMRPRIQQIEWEVRAMIELRKSPVANFLNKLTLGDVCLGIGAAFLVATVANEKK